MNTGDARVQNAVFENNQLWISMGVGCYLSGDPALHACARVVGVNTADDQNPTLTVNWTWGLAQGKDLYYPTLMSSTDGGVYTVFGYSSAGETPSIGMINHPEASDSNWYPLTAGTGANESGRWGDYFGVARDPSDGTHVWVAAAYGTGGPTWSTTVAALGSSPFTIKPPPPIPECVVPHMVGLTLSAATASLYAHRCARGVVTLKYSNLRAGVVLSQREAAGTHLAESMAIDLTESRGRHRKKR